MNPNRCVLLFDVPLRRLLRHYLVNPDTLIVDVYAYIDCDILSYLIYLLYR